METNMQEAKEIVDGFHGLVTHIKNKFEGLRRENYEISNISKSFSQVREELAMKAEKMDVFAIHDKMGKRAEVQRLNDDIQVLK